MLIRLFRALLVTVLLSLSLPTHAASSRALNAAQSAIDDGEFRTAIIQLKKLLKKDELDGEARLMLGKLYLQLGNAVAAEKELRFARKAGIKKSRWVIPHARSLLAQGKGDKIESETGDVSHLSKRVQADLAAIKGNAWLIKKDTNKAMSAYLRADTLDPGNLDATLGMARLAAINGNLEKASRLVDKAGSRGKNRPEVLTLKAGIAQEGKRHDQAIEIFDRLLEDQSGNLQALLGRATSLVTLERFDEAQQDLATILKYQPGNLQARYLLAVIDYHNADRSAAKDKLIEILRLSPKLAGANYLAAHVYFDDRQYEVAKHHIDTYLQAAPGNANALKLLATIQLRLGEAEAAAENLQRYLGSNPDDAQATALLGSAFMASRKFEESSRLLERAIDLSPDNTGSRFAYGLSQMAQGHTDTAIEQLQKVVSATKTFSRADRFLALAYLNAKQPGLALTAATESVERNPESAQALLLLGKVQQLGKQTDQARASFEKALALEPGTIEAGLGLARLDMQENRGEIAEDRLLKLHQQHRKNIPVMMLLAQVADRNDRKEAAIEWVEKAHTANPDAALPALTLARIKLAKKDIAGALALIRHLYTKAPKNPVVVRALAQLLMREGSPQSALRYWKELDKLSPQSAEGLYGIALIHNQAKDLPAAIATINQILQRRPKDLKAMVVKSELERRSGDNSAAGMTIAKIKNVFPRLAIGYGLEGDQHRRQHQYIEAANAYQKALELQPSKRIAGLLFSSMQKAGKPLAAYQVLEDWLDKHPAEDDLRKILAASYQEAGLTRQALSHYDKISAANQNDLVVLNNLAWHYHTIGDAKALDFARRAYELAPKRAEVIDTYASVLHKEGQFAEALALFEKAVTLSPSRPDLRLHWAQALAQAGKQTIARQQLDKVLAYQGKFAERKDAEQLAQELGGQLRK